mmetsp:Transcript_14467/g.40284  ORF Transcript_14467/g.40284 Transcript_14467/m.40284 type:complete len:141 (-) Transcript_14467:60-482(-)
MRQTGFSPRRGGRSSPRGKHRLLPNDIVPRQIPMHQRLSCVLPGYAEALQGISLLVPDGPVAYFRPPVSRGSQEGSGPERGTSADSRSARSTAGISLGIWSLDVMTGKSEATVKRVAKSNGSMTPDSTKTASMIDFNASR